MPFISLKRIDVFLQSSKLESLLLGSEVLGIRILFTRVNDSSWLAILAEEYLLLYFFEVVFIGKFPFLFIVVRVLIICGAFCNITSIFGVYNKVWLLNDRQMLTRAWIIVGVVTNGLLTNMLRGIPRIRFYARCLIKCCPTTLISFLFLNLLSTWVTDYGIKKYLFLASFFSKNWALITLSHLLSATTRRSIQLNISISTWSNDK